MIGSMNSVQPAPSLQRKFDLSTIDTAEEAMIMPGADLWAGLVLGPLSGRVTVSSGGQELAYEIMPAPQGIYYRGHLNGEGFLLEGKSARPRGIQVTGETAGGDIDSLRRGGGGGFGLDGSAGEVDFSQMLALDRSGGTSGQLAYLGGTIHGEKLEARARKGENGEVLVTGTLGELPLNQTIRQGPGQEWIIKGQVGEHRYTEIIERY